MMIPMNEVESDILKLRDIYFRQICLNSNIPTEGKKTVKVGFREEHVINGRDIAASLFCLVKVGEDFTIELCLCGDFVCSKPENAEKLLPNVFSIMFPYLRSQVTVMTAMPGCQSMVLPALNIVKLLEHSKQRESAEE